MQVEHVRQMCIHPNGNHLYPVPVRRDKQVTRDSLFIRSVIYIENKGALRTRLHLLL